MIVYPAIDIKDSKCVRLLQGDFDKVTVYGSDPAAQARLWQSLGGEFLHVVDLDGARSGVRVNQGAIESIIKAVTIPVEVGGGMRSMEALDEVFSAGAARAVIGTAAVEDKAFLKAAILKYGDKIAVGIDADGGIVKTSGWEKSGNVGAIELAKEMEDCGVKTVIYTDIATDGMLKGPNFEAMDEMNRAVSCDITASGGVSCREDIQKLYSMGIAGVITGKALFDGRLSLSDALSAARGE